MMSKFNQSIIAICVIGCSFSCSDILSTDSELVEFEEDNTLNHATDSVYSVLGIVNKMQHIADRVVLLGEMRGDLVTTTDAASADLKRLASFDLKQQNKYNQVSDYYAVINNCNFYLAHVDTALQRRGRNIFINEYAVVKAYRAWTYLELAKIYGEVPLVLQPLMTEQKAREAMNQKRVGITEICNYFIDDLTPFAKTELPNFGTIKQLNSVDFFLPMRALLGDLCLWAGRYREAARWYHDYLNDEQKPVLLNYSARVTWRDAVTFDNPSRGYNVTSDREYLSYIPMESRVFDGVVSDLGNVFNSTEENKYFFQATPSKAMSQLSAAQTYCLEYKTDTRTDTIYIPKTGMSKDIYVGDLRFSSNYTVTSLGGQDAYSETNTTRQTISKLSTQRVTTYRRSMVYLRYAEALNRAGLPQSAFAVLKYGLCADNVAAYIDAAEQQDAGDLIAFDVNEVTKEKTIGIHSLGSGDSHVNGQYVLPMPATSLPTRQDTIDYQIPLVEDMIINEMALEGAFEGYRYYDLMRVALRRNDPSYLANAVARREGTVNAQLQSLLLDKSNWYLPLP